MINNKLLIQRLSLIIGTFFIVFSHGINALTIKLKPDVITFTVGVRIASSGEPVLSYIILLNINNKDMLSFSPGLLQSNEKIIFQLPNGSNLLLPISISQRLVNLLQPNGDSIIQCSPLSSFPAGTLLPMHPAELFIMMYLGFGVTDFSDQTPAYISSHEMQLPFNNLDQVIAQYPLPAGSIVIISHGHRKHERTMVMYLGEEYFLEWNKAGGHFTVRTAKQMDKDQPAAISYSLLIECHSDDMPKTQCAFLIMVSVVYKIWISQFSPPH